MQKFLHIGYPKNLSTSLQRTFFSKHPEIFYLGIGSGGDISYRDPVVDSFFENDVKYCRQCRYVKKESAIQRHFLDLMKQAESEGFVAFGASSEHLCISLTSDNIETGEKARRLQRIFGTNTKLLVVIRNQADLLKSIYREGIRIGYAGTFEEYVRFLYLFQDRNFIPDCEFDSVIEVFAGFFGRENIKVFPYELFVDDGVTERLPCGQHALVNAMENWLGLSNHGIELGHSNKSIPIQVLEAKRLLNAGAHHDLGNQLWNGAENHRLGKYWNHELNAGLTEDEIYVDVREKRRLIAEAERNTREMEVSRTPYALSGNAELYWARLMTRLTESNRRLQAMNLPERFDLPPSYTSMLGNLPDKRPST